MSGGQLMNDQACSVACLLLGQQPHLCTATNGRVDYDCIVGLACFLCSAASTAIAKHFAQAHRHRDGRGCKRQRSSGTQEGGLALVVS